MKVIVDAYNVLHYTAKDKQVSQQERKCFINQLSAYAKNKGNAVIVVFDGGPFLFPSSFDHKGITVKYSGPQMSADEIILCYIKEHAGDSMVLISSDRALCTAAKFYEVESVDAKDFYDFIIPAALNCVSKSTQAVKIGQSDTVVDLLMMQTVVQKKSEDMSDLFEKRKSPAKRLSKKIKKRMHKIKKL
jgi:predicted RNA-binding protein with PIN domain